MKEKIEIIFNEYNAILTFRARCIKNIDEGIRTYLIFLGFNVTAISFFTNNNPPNLILISVLLALCALVGFFIYEQMVETYINLVIYTKKLNLTRKCFCKWKNARKCIYLPISEEKPDFDETGYTEKKYSEFGILRLIQILNSLTASTAIFLLINTFRALNVISISEICNFIISTLIGFLLFFWHQYFNNIQNAEARNKWTSELKKLKKEFKGK